MPCGGGRGLELISMGMDTAVHDWCTMPTGSKHDGHLTIYPQIPAANGLTAEELEALLFLPADGVDARGHLNVPSLLFPSATADSASPPRGVSVSATPAGQPPPGDAEAFSDIVLGYINRMLMAEDIDEKFEHYPAPQALLEAEKPFLDILADQSLYSDGSTVESPDGSSVTNSCYRINSCNCIAASDGLGAVQTTTVLEFPTAEFLEPPQQLYLDLSPESIVIEAGGSWQYDPTQFNQVQTHPVAETLLLQSSSFTSSNGSNVAFTEGFKSSLSSANVVLDVGFNDFILQSQQAMQFNRGFEEASKFLPEESKLVINVDRLPSITSLQAGVKEEMYVKIKEKGQAEATILQGKKHFCGDDLDTAEGRCNKHSASATTIDTDHLVRVLMDKVLLCNGDTCSNGVKELRESLRHDVAKHSTGAHGKVRGKKQPKKEVVDLETLLIHCAQSVATDDRRNATELLKQIREHASAKGDGVQRLAHCFANGLEARLAGNGSQIYKSFTTTRLACTDVLKAYQLYLAACPFKKISHYFANQNIMNVVENAKKVHIVDYGIYYGFQWPCFIQLLSKRIGGPPKLRITGIDTPQPGFRPAERIEETGIYLSDYARTFHVPFEFRAIASIFEAVQKEDLHIEEDEILIVNCMLKFKTLMDESVVADSPRNMTLNTIRKMEPHLFIHGITNGSYNAPFFLSRFREALFHYSAVFDMLETNIPRDNEHRLLIESVLFNREAINVISCEGLERMERPETYKQWQVRNQRAGFKQLLLNQDIMKHSREKVKCYHKNFIIDEDNRWLLQGWKGRILFALSAWKPDHRSSS